MIHVCCLTPTWNRREFIPRALDCFQKQRHPADWKLELIVFDDGADKVLDIMQRFPDPRIRYVQLDGPETHVGRKAERRLRIIRGGLLRHLR